MSDYSKYHRFRMKNATVAQAREWLLDRLWEGVICPVCGKPRRIYNRSFDAGMARDLIVMYRSGADQDYIYTSFDIDNSGTLSKMAHWELITMGEGRGWWKITEKGVDFVKGNLRIPHKVSLYNKKVVEFDDSKYVDIFDALGTKFNYEELMAR